MARVYKRDANGRFASSGGTSRTGAAPSATTERRKSTTIARDVRWMMRNTISDPIKALRVWEKESNRTLSSRQFDEVVKLATQPARVPRRRRRAS